MNAYARSLDASFTLGDRRTAPSRERLRVRCYAGLMAAEGLAPLAAIGLAATLAGEHAGKATLAFSVLLAISYLGLAVYGRAFTIDALRSWKLGAGRSYIAAALAFLAAAGSTVYLELGLLPSRAVFVGAFAIELVLLLLSRFVGKVVAMRLFGGVLVSQALIVDNVDVAGSGIAEKQDVLIDADLRGLKPSIDDPIMLDHIGRTISPYDRVFVACPHERRAAWARALKGSGVQAEIIISELDELGPLGAGRFHDTSTVVVASGMLALRERALKRALDLSIALPSLLFLLPLFAVVAILIKLDNPGPVFFLQKRVGRGNKLFAVYKFRSMKSDRLDSDASKLTQRNDDRVTRIGRFLRKSSIDELPQLLNILFGNMSLVGPRPHATGATAGEALYWEVDDRYFHRHAAKPGLTGLAQVRGFRGNTETSTDLANRLQADLEYLSGWSIWRDLTILARTAKVVIHSNAY